MTQKKMQIIRRYTSRVGCYACNNEPHRVQGCPVCKSEGMLTIVSEEEVKDARILKYVRRYDTQKLSKGVKLY